MKHDGYVSILLAITLHYGVQGFVPLIPNRVPHCLIEAPSSFTTRSSTRISAGRGRGRGGGRGGGGGGRTRRSGGRGGRGRGDGRGGRGRGGRGRGGRGRQADDTFDSDPFGDQNSYGDDGDSSPRYEPQPEYQDRSTSFDDDDDGNDFFGDFEEDFEYDDDDNEEEEESMENSVSQPRPPPSQFFSKKPISDPSVSTSVDDDKAKANNALFLQLCHGAGISKPSRIQALAWPMLLAGKSAIVADQTGSGKTLAYLLPLLQQVLSKPMKKKEYGAPRILIMAPTAELADQTRFVCDQLSESRGDLTTKVITATGKYATNIRDQIRMLSTNPMDILITTPGRIATILRSKKSVLDLSNVQSIVLDEVDILMIDETFGPQLRTVGAAAPVDQIQFVFVTATLPKDIERSVTREFPNVSTIKGPGLHRVAPTVKEHLVDVSVPSSSNQDAQICYEIKAKQLMKALRSNRCERTLVFCNTVENCRKVENLLQRSDRRGRLVNVGAYHNAMTPESRNRNLADFAHGLKKNKGSGKMGERNDANHILVCTDRAARGVDFDSAPVDHVILFDFPKDPAEYVRRVGRTARAGRTGTSTVFAYG